MRKLFLNTFLGISLVSLAWFTYSIFGSSSMVNSEADKAAVSRTLFTPPETPRSLTLFGERMPLEYPDVYESFDREIFTNCYYHSSTIRMLKLAPRFVPLMKRILQREGIPTDFIYLAMAESALNPSAISPAGAVGIWQFLPRTGPEYGLEVNREVDERYHVEKATEAACRYFRKSYERFGSWTLVAAAFNAGNAGMSKQMERQKQSDYYDLLLNQETARYVFRIAALKVIMEDPVKFGFYIPKERQYAAWQTREVEVSTAISSFPDWCAEHHTNYKVLKILNPWLRQDNLENKTAKTYVIKLPKKGERI